VNTSGATPIGLRERNKARTRLAISDVATRLFIEHGFENVTVAQVADAAQVSVKTVFNYFSSKEELFFDRADDVLAEIVRAVLERPQGATALGALHRLFADRCVPFVAGWGQLRDRERYAYFRSFIVAEHAAPALRARRLVIAESWRDRLAAVFVDELGIAELSARAMAAMVIAAMTLRERELSAAMLERASARQVERRVRAVVDEAFDRIARAFEDIDRPRA
jgi:AcrR family transcriptional regulator